MAAELEDALQVLSAVEQLHEREQCALRAVLRELDAITEQRRPPRRLARKLRRLTTSVVQANDALGSGLAMQIGQGTLLF